MTMKISCCFLMCLLILSKICLSQKESCASSLMQQKISIQQADFNEKLIANETKIQTIIQKRKLSKTAEEILIIPLVIHVVHLGEPLGIAHNISEEQIIGGVKQLNDAFQNKNGAGVDLKIAFELAAIDENCNPTSGIQRVNGSTVPGYASNGVALNGPGAEEIAVKALSKWSNKSYYNIWLVSEFDDNDGGSGTQGFAYFPAANTEVDGAMILNSAWGNSGTVNTWNNSGVTGIHEIGHALSLYHTFEGDNGGTSCPAGACGKLLGDCCDDTAPHKRSSSDCDSLSINSCTGLQNDQVIQNYMDYSSQYCTIQFTADQKARMRAALQGPRNSLLLSNTTQTKNPSFTPPKKASCTPSSAEKGLNGGFSGIMLAEITGVAAHKSYNTQNDGGYVDESDQCVSTAVLVSGTSYQFKTNIWYNEGQVTAWIDFNNNGEFSVNEKIYDHVIAGNTDDSATFQVPLDATTNSYLRMRVICDLNDISSACHNPEYGQAEDYSVLIKNSLSSNQKTSNEVYLSVTPNPFTDHLSISNGSGESLEYTLHDATGRTLIDGFAKQNQLINMLWIPSGIYYLNIKQEGNVVSKVLVKP